MKELIKLLKIVTFCDINNFTEIENNDSGKEGRLLFNIKSGIYKTDAEAAKDLYNSDQNDVRYKMLKLRLKRKLFKNLFFFDYTKTKLMGYLKDEQECKHLIHHAEVLIRQGEYDISKRLLNKALIISKRFEFTSLTVTILSSVLLIEGETGALKSYINTQREYAHYHSKLLKESEAKSLYYLIKLNLNKSIKVRKQFLPSIQQDLEQLQKLWEGSGTYDNFDFYYKVNLWFNELIGDFNQIIILTKQTESWLIQGLINEHRFNLRYHRYITVYAHLRAKLLDKGLEYASLYKQDFDPNFPNWFVYMENYLLLAVHAKKYEQASNIISEVFNNSAFQKIKKVTTERWNLYKTYLIFLNPNTSLTSNISFQDFSSTVPEYSKDKQGFNVAILILQFMYYLRKGDAEALLYRIESIKKYVLFHLKDSFSNRSKIFLKLLILTVVEDFDAAECRVKGKLHYEKLISTPPPGDAYAEIEIIPYEHLWELILHILENKTS